MKYCTSSHRARKRDLILVKSMDTDHNKGVWRYLKDKGLIPEYLFESGYAGNLHFTSQYTDDEINQWKQDEFDYNGKHYVVLKQPLGLSDVFELMDYVHDTEIMKWVENKKYGTKECRFDSGMFEFHCICQKDNTVIIDVKYTKCDNKHKNKVTVSTIEITNADNMKILEAIEQWKESFLDDVNNLNV